MLMTKKLFSSSLLFVASVGLCIGCGGGVTSKKGMSRLAADAPPPPPPPPGAGGGGSSGPKVKASREAKKDYMNAAAFYTQQAKAGWDKGTCKAAAQRFESVASNHSKLADASYMAGLSYQNCGMNQDASEQYQKAVKVNPGHAPSLSNLGQIYFKGGNETRAKQYWNSAVQADKKTAAARNNLAWLIIRDIRKLPKGANFKAKEKEAARHLSSVLAVENGNVEAYVLYSLLYMHGSKKNKSRLALAKLLLDKATEIDKGFAPLWNARGLLLLRQDNVAKSLSMFERAVQLDPKFFEARMNVGNIVLDFRKYADAEVHFTAALKMKPKDYDGRIGLGLAQRGLRKYNLAEKSYAKAIKLDSRRAEAYFNLGVLWQDFRANQTEDLNKAQNAYRSAAKYFRQSKNKSNASAELRKEADENIKVCDKNIKSLEEAKKFRKSAPKPTKSK